MNTLLIVLGIIFFVGYGYWLMTRFDNFIRSNQSGTNAEDCGDTQPERRLIASLRYKMHHV